MVRVPGGHNVWKSLVMPPEVLEFLQAQGSGEKPEEVRRFLDRLTVAVGDNRSGSILVGDRGGSYVKSMALG